MAIYKRGEKYWYDFWVNKKRERGTTGHVHKRKAQVFHDDLQARLKRVALGLEVTITNTITIYDAYEKYLTDPELVANVRASSLYIKRTSWEGGDKRKQGSLVLKDIIKDAPLHTLGEKHVEIIRAECIQRNEQNRSINNRITQLKAFTKWCAKKKHLLFDPLAQIVKLDEPEQKHKLISDDDLDNLLATLPTWLREIVWIDWQVGIRLSNITALRYDQINFENECFEFAPDDMKKGKTTYIDLEPEVLEWFRNRRKAHPDEIYVWPSPYKKREHYTREHVTNVFSQHARAIGLECTFHSIRHTFATRWAESGMDLPSLGKLLSHKNLASTQIYVHVEDLHAQRQAKKKVVLQRKAPSLRLVQGAS